MMEVLYQEKRKVVWTTQWDATLSCRGPLYGQLYLVQGSTLPLPPATKTLPQTLSNGKQRDPELFKSLGRASPFISYCKTLLKVE